jgi:phage baseplate assembly protein W
MAFKLGEINAEIDGIAELFQRIKILCMTEKRSLPGDPNYGVAISQYIPYSENNKPAIMSQILEAIGRYEPDIRVAKIEVGGSNITITVEGVGTIVI